MFLSRHWAEAFIKSTEVLGGEADEGLEALKTLVPWAASLPGMISGSYAALKLEKLVREGIAAGGSSASPALEAAVRFLVLMVKKNALSRSDSVIDEVQKILDARNGIVRASLEYALAPDEDESRITGAIRKRTGASVVRITRRLNPELIGGYRLIIGDEMIDASIRSQLEKLETCLAFGGGES